MMGMDSETEVAFAWVAASEVASSSAAGGASGGKAAQAAAYVAEVAELPQLGQGLVSFLLKKA